MAVLASILHPSQETINIASLAASTASAEQSVGPNRIIAINADQDIGIVFGQTGLAAPSATSFRIPQNQTMTFDMGHQNSVLRVFNKGASAANIYIMFLHKM